MNELRHPTVIFLCGWAGSGKTSIADRLKKILKIHCANIDAVRAALTGKPKNPLPETPEELEEEAVAMLANYGFTAHGVDWHLANNRSLIVTATFSKEKYWDLFRPVFEKHSHAKVKIIQCAPMNDTPEEVMRMLKKREEEEGYVAGVSTLERYLEVKGRWKEPPLPFEKIATWGSGNSIEDSARQAAEYVLRDT